MTAPEGRAAGPSNLVVRVLSAIVLAPGVLAVIWLGGWAFAALVLAAAVLCYREWAEICGLGARAPLAWLGYGGLAAAGVLGGLGENQLAISAVLAVCAVTAAVGLRQRSRAWPALGVLYAGLPLLALLILRAGEAGLWALALVVAVTWATDIAAYFVGRTLGGPKLWPAVSPKKTWSGAIGGLAGAVIAGLAIVVVTGIGSHVSVALVSALLSVVAQFGDLAESAFKRHFGVKDSGELIPGHGGIMDRIDGLVAAAVGAWLIGLAAAGGDPSTGLTAL